MCIDMCMAPAHVPSAPLACAVRMAACARGRFLLNQYLGRHANASRRGPVPITVSRRRRRPVGPTPDGPVIGIVGAVITY